MSIQSTSAYDIGYANGYNSVYNTDYTAGYIMSFNETISHGGINIGSSSTDQRN